MDFDIETVSDVLSLIFKMDDQLDVEFTGKKNKKGEYDSKSIALRFNNPQSMTDLQNGQGQGTLFKNSGCQKRV